MNRRFLAGLIVLLLGGLSSLVLFSISRTEALGQLLFALSGLGIYALIQKIPRRLLLRASFVTYCVVFLLLIFTFVVGYTAKGASRWFRIGPVRIQVSEIAKPVLALTLSVFVMRYPLRTQRRIFFFLLLTMLYVGAVLIEPDLGSSMVLFAISMGVLFASISHPRLLLPWFLLFGVGVVCAWMFVLRPYQKERIFSFIGKSDQSGSSYNARQSLITFGSGKLFGRGIGHGVQTSLRFLPEHHTDFFFASFAEETGFVGVSVVLLLYGLLFLLLWSRIGYLQQFDFIFRLALISGLFFQFGVHVLMNMGLAPVTGIPLPFLSSGGSSFLSLSIFLGLGLRFSKELPHMEKESDFGFVRTKKQSRRDTFAQIGFS